MNPAMTNYLQSQQQNDQTQGVPQAQAPVFNPFDSGIKNAIESARVSLDMTEKQQDKAMRRSMLSFANAYSQEPRQKGFMANFGSVARSLSPAILEHDNAEDVAFKENNALANQILAYQAAEQNRQAQQEDKMWHRSHAENQLNEQRRYHNMMGERHKQNQVDNTPVEVNGVELQPITTQKNLDLYLKDKKALGGALHQVNTIEDAFKQFRTDYKDNWIDPMSPAKGVANPTKDFIGRFFNNAELKKETTDRNAFTSRVNQFVVAAENQLRGGGVLGPRLIELFRQLKIYPSMETDMPDEFQAKLSQIKEEIENSYNAANLSLKYRAHIDPSQVHSLLNTNEGQSTSNTALPETKVNVAPVEITSGSQPNYNVYTGKKGYPVVAMLTPEGELREVPPEKVARAIEEGGLTVMKPDNGG